MQIAEAMRNNGVTFDQMAQATGLNPQDIQSRYQAAISPVQGLSRPTTTPTNRQPITIGNGTSKVTTFIPGTNGSDMVYVPPGTMGNGTNRVTTLIDGRTGLPMTTGAMMPWSAISLDGQSQTAQTLGAPQATSTPAATPQAIGNDQITDWLSRNPGATDAQIAQTMQQYGVSPLQMSQATGLDYGSVLNRYNDATGTKAPIANADVADWYSRNQGLGDAEIAQYMNNYGVTPDQLAASIGANPAAVQSRYDAATAPATSGPVPPAVAADLSTPPPGYTPPQTGTGYSPMINDLSQHTTGGTGSSLGGLGGPAADILRGGAGTPGAQPGFGGTGAFGQYGGYGAFGTQSSPWMSSVADDIMRRTQDALGQSFNAIRSNAVGVGGLGGSRQGVAEGLATRGAMDSMQGQLANLYNNDYQNTQNRGLQAYGIDTNAYLGNQNQWMNFGLGLGNQALTNQGQMLNFYGNERRTDLDALRTGADLYSAGFGGEWSPIQNAANIYRPFSGMGGSETESSSRGGGLLGALGGAGAGYQWYRGLQQPSNTQPASTGWGSWGW